MTILPILHAMTAINQHRNPPAALSGLHNLSLQGAAWRDMQEVVWLDMKSSYMLKIAAVLGALAILILTASTCRPF